MSIALHSKLASLADSFANAVLDAVRATSLQELLTNTASSTRHDSGVRPSKTAPPKAERVAGSGRRLARRSSADIANALDQIVALVKSHKGGLRAEEIRGQLHMQSKEMPRVLAEGLAKRKLRKKGQKRATTYFA